jgi:uncharacterized protein (TIGR02996 family)
MADRLVYRGEEWQLESTPLEPHLRNLPARPDFRVPLGVSRTGYVACWEVRPDDTLWLTALQTLPADEAPDPGLRLLFPAAAGPVPAAWVSHQVRGVDFKSVRFSVRGPGPAYDRHLHLWMASGRVVLAEEFRRAGMERADGRFTPHLEAVFGPEEGAFLRAIYADQADSAPRLVYADWLDERNDPRGTVIRLVERTRAMDLEAARRERSAHADLLARELRQGVWTWVLGYDAEAAAAQPIFAGW